MPLAFLVLGGAMGLMSLGQSLAEMMVLAMAFFLAFNLLEAAMPSMVSQLEWYDRSGTENGFVYDIPVSGRICRWPGRRLVTGIQLARVVTLRVCGIDLVLCGRWP